MIWKLLILYQIKHFLCDYPLQGQYMLGKFKKFPDFILPLFSHALVHGMATYYIALEVTHKPNSAFLLGLLDLAVHFTVDRIKASPSLLGRFKALSGKEYFNLVQPKLSPDDMSDEQRARHEERKTQLFRSNKFFWWSLGLDQGLHHLTHYFIIYMLLKG